MDRRAFMAIGGGILAAPFSAQAQQAGKMYRIGYLSQLPRTDRSSQHLLGQLLQGLRDLGYIEGQNLVIEHQWAAGNIDRLPDLARELVRGQVDVIVTPGTPQSLAVKHATNTIPIVMVAVGDPVGSGLVASLARPGGNITGLSLGGLELLGKQLELLKEVVPRLTRVVVLRNPANPYHAVILKDADVVARALRVKIQIVEARRSDDFNRAFTAMTREHAEGLFVPADSVFLLHLTRLADLAIQSRLPAMSGQRQFVEAGGLMVYAPDQGDLWRRAAYFVDKILKGTKPADLPVEQPTKFELVINLKTAKALGLDDPAVHPRPGRRSHRVAHARPTRPAPPGSPRLRHLFHALLRSLTVGPSYLARLVDGDRAHCGGDGASRV